MQKYIHAIRKNISEIQSSYFDNCLVLHPFTDLVLVKTVRKPEYSVEWYFYQTDGVCMCAEDAASMEGREPFKPEDLDSVSDYTIARVEIIIDSLENIIDAYIVKNLI